MRAARAAGQSPDGAVAYPSLATGVIVAGATAAGDYFPQPSAPAGTRLDDALGGDAWLITLDSLSREPLRPFAAALRDWLESRGVEAVLVRPDRYVFAAGEANTVLTAWDRQAAGPRPRRP